MKRVFGVLFLLVGFFVWVTPVEASNTYYMATTGSDSGTGSQSSPWATFTKAWGVMQPGDTLLLKDGIYKQSLDPSINGAPNTSTINDNTTTGALDPAHPLDDPVRTANYVKVKAEHDGMAIIEGDTNGDGLGDLLPIAFGNFNNGNFGKGNYFWVEGLVVRNSKESVVSIWSHNVVLKRITAINANPWGNSHVIMISAGGSLPGWPNANSVYNPANILIEDTIAAGSGRKMVLSYSTFVNVILRRVVAVHGDKFYGGADPRSPTANPYCGSYWPQEDGIESYHFGQPDAASNLIVENSIVLGNVEEWGFDVNAWNGNLTANQFLGDIALFAGMHTDGTSHIWDCKSMASECGAQKCHDVKSWPTRVGFGIGLYGGVTTMKNNLIQDIFVANSGGKGFGAGGEPVSFAGSGTNKINRATIVNNGVGFPSGNGTGINAIDSELLKFEQVSNSRIPGTSFNNGSGATLVNQYVNGQLTSQSLWPLPMQDRVLKDLGYDITGEVTEILRTSGTQTGSSVPVPIFSPMPPRPITNLNVGNFDVSYTAPVDVTITNPAGGTIRYTLDGAEPTSSSTQYSGPIHIASTTFLKAKAFTSSGISFSRSAYYRINSVPNVAPQVDVSVLSQNNYQEMENYLEMVWPTNTAQLYGRVEDFTFPTGLSKLDSTWTQLSGPGTLTFADSKNPRTQATFPQVGTYKMRLTASDGALSTSRDVTVQIWPTDLVGVGAFNIPGKIEAENYRSGGEGSGYHQTHSYGDGYYRQGSRVDLEVAHKDGSGFAISDIYPGEWYAYNVNVAAAGTYGLRVRIAAAQGGGTFHLEMDGSPITGTITVPSDSAHAVGTYAYFFDINTMANIPSAGNHILKLVSDTASTYDGVQMYNAINYLEFNSQGSCGTSCVIGTGDVNGDAKIDVLDLKGVLGNYLRTGAQGLNQYGVDSKINVLDFAVVLKRLP